MKSWGDTNMNIGERILLSLSRSPKGNDFPQKEATIDDALNLLTRAYADFSALVLGKRVVDFGCGAGYQSIALASRYGCSVVGVDSNQRTLRKAIDNAKNHNVSPQQLSFVESSSLDMLNSFDVVVSQNSFEHFTDPEKVLHEMSSLLKNSGIILLTFGLPWLSPYGSHMHFFCKVPWINVLFPEETVMKSRSHFRSDGAKRYEDVESGLNKMTIAKFESIISSCDLKVVYKKYECVKGINWLSKVPLLREFFINHVAAILSKAT
jgi:ubiquinone/menaquinone biosynthesis C-methylase UbiE